MIGNSDCTLSTGGEFARNSNNPDPGGDHRQGADDLRLRREPVWIGFVGRAGKVLVHTVEAEPKDMHSLLPGLH